MKEIKFQVTDQVYEHWQHIREHGGRLVIDIKKDTIDVELDTPMIDDSPDKPEPPELPQNVNWNDELKNL